MIDLKPCPFCGGAVRIEDAYDYLRETVIYCDLCDMTFALDNCHATKTEVCDAWNRRASDEQPI